MPVTVSKRPTITPKAKWTPEEDEKLLELEEKCNGRWEKIPNELSHTPFECDLRCLELRQCDLRCLELRQQMLKAKRQQQKEPKLMLPPENLDPQSSRSASQLVSKAHKEAVNSLSGSGNAQLGIVAADNSALRATTENDAAMISSVRNILGSVFNISVDNQVVDPAIIKLRECEVKAVELSKERDQLVKQKESAIQEALLWRIELEKTRDHVAFLEAAVRGAEERARNAEITAEAKDMEQRKTATLVEKQLLAYINALQAQVQRTNTQQQIETNEDFSKRHFSDTGDAHLLTKHVESSFKNLDKPSKRLKISSNFEAGGSQGSIHLTDDAQWNQGTVEIQEEEVKGPSTHDSTID